MANTWQNVADTCHTPGEIPLTRIKKISTGTPPEFGLFSIYQISWYCTLEHEYFACHYSITWICLYEYVSSIKVFWYNIEIFCKVIKLLFLLLVTIPLVYKYCLVKVTADSEKIKDFTLISTFCVTLSAESRYVKGAQAWDFRLRFFCFKITHLVPWYIT